MKVKIIVARNKYPIVGKVIDVEESEAQYLIDVGLAELPDTKPEKRAVKPSKEEK